MYYGNTQPSSTVQLDDAGAIICVSSYRRRGERPRRRRPQLPPAVARDRHRPAPKSVRLELVLYTSAESEKSQRALRTLQRVMEKFDREQVSLTVRDLADRPTSGDEDSVVFTPTLVKRGPGPRTWIVGNLDQDELVIDLFDVSGVDRKKDGR